MDYKLENNEWDMAFDFKVGKTSLNDFATLTLCKTPSFAYMLESNPPSKKKMLSAQDPQTQRCIARSIATEPDVFLVQQMATGNTGVELPIVAFVSNAYDSSLNILDDDVIFLADRFYSERFNPRLVSRPVNSYQSELALRYRLSLKDDCSDIFSFSQRLCSFFRDLFQDS